MVRASRPRPTRIRRAGMIGALITAVIVVVAGCGTGKDAVTQSDSFQFVSPGGKAEIFYEQAKRNTVRDFAGPNVDTKARISLADYAGQIVVVNVWASWCGPCIAESDHLERTFEAFKWQGVAFLGVNFRDSNRDGAKDFMANHKVGYPSIYDFSGKTLATWNAPVNVIPTTLVIDRDRRAAAVFLRSVSEQDLRPLLERLVREPRRAPTSSSLVPAGPSSSPAQGIR